MNDNHLGEAKPRGPGEPEGDILYHDGVVDVGPGVDQLLPQPPVLPRTRREEAEVHPYHQHHYLSLTLFLIVGHEY